MMQVLFVVGERHIEHKRVLIIWWFEKKYIISQQHLFIAKNSMDLSQNLKNEKVELLRYFRARAEEEMNSISKEFTNSQFKEKTRAMNHFLQASREKIISAIKSVATEEGWNIKTILESVLMVTYTNDVVMLETRNSIWEYDYMAFSRRIGELWEPFCKTCFDYPINKVSIFVPPLFADVKRNMTNEIIAYIEKLNISDEEKSQLRQYYDKVWSLVSSGEIKLECDLHFKYKSKKYIVDFKSGFGSNEKGNTNRLLLVGTIYKNISNDFKCLIFVRSTDNNHYLTTLQNSGVWDTYQGVDTYRQIKYFTGYDLQEWINNNVAWMDDFSDRMKYHINTENLGEYLIW